MSNEITFDQIRVGDRIRVSDRSEYANGDSYTDTAEFTVIGKTKTIAEGAHRDVYDSGRPGRTITLLDRPAPTPPPTPKVGDSLTPEQIMALPDSAVFLDITGLPRVVKGPHTVGVSGPTPREFHNARGGHYYLVYLPKEAGSE